MAESATGPVARNDVMNFVSSIVSAYVSKNPVPMGDLPNIIRNVHSTLSGLGKALISQENAQKPAVPVKKSITPDYIVCLEDGRKLKMLKRYLRTTYQLSPDQYRSKWGLPRDYPMVCPNYSARRSEFAKEIGLGRSRVQTQPKRRKR